MKYYLIVGEASGDLHASNLMKALQKEDLQADFRFWGGDKMAAVGGQLVKHYRDLAFMGIIEVLKNLPTIKRNFKSCKEDILNYEPDVLILIDYSGFNLRMAKWAKQQGLKVFYYIAPQVWASRSDRAKEIKQYVDQLFATLPFEPAFYKKYGMSINFVGHPLLDVVNHYSFNSSFLSEHHINRPIIALLPGSRKQEINKVLEVLLSIVGFFKDYQFIIAAAPAIPLSFYKDIIGKTASSSSIKLISGSTYDILKNAKAAIVTSGTATLETALLNVPQVVCYKGNWLSYQIAKRFIKVPYISLVNLIVDKELVKELIQHDLTVAHVRQELELLLDEERASSIKEGYHAIRMALGEQGASERTAELMVRYLREGDLALPS